MGASWPPRDSDGWAHAASRAALPCAARRARHRFHMSSPRAGGSNGKEAAASDRADQGEPDQCVLEPLRGKADREDHGARDSRARWIQPCDVLPVLSRRVRPLRTARGRDPGAGARPCPRQAAAGRHAGLFSAHGPGGGPRAALRRLYAPTHVGRPYLQRPHEGDHRAAARPLHPSRQRDRSNNWLNYRSSQLLNLTGHLSGKPRKPG